MRLIELDLVDGGSHDCVPQHLVLVEAFDGTKNEHFPDAEAFVLYHSDAGAGHLLTSTTFEEIGEAIRQADPADWFEVSAKAGNRVLLRRSMVTARRSLEEGSAVTVMLGGANREVEIVEDMATLRETMNNPTMPDGPPGLQPVEPA